jgi:glutamate synthase domain-containing protein 2
MPNVTMTLEEYEALRRLIGSERESEGAVEEARVAPKKKRKVSAYQKMYGKMYKQLKAKHPRMSFGAISKKAHKMTKKEMN